MRALNFNRFRHRRMATNTDKGRTRAVNDKSRLNLER